MNDILKFFKSTQGIALVVLVVVVIIGYTQKDKIIKALGIGRGNGNGTNPPPNTTPTPGAGTTPNPSNNANAIDWNKLLQRAEPMQTGDEVKELQKMLNAHLGTLKALPKSDPTKVRDWDNLTAIGEDGKFGDGTKAALKKLAGVESSTLANLKTLLNKALEKAVLQPATTALNALLG